MPTTAPGTKLTMWYLLGQTSDSEALRQIPIRPIPFTVGRRADCSLPLSSPTVSGLHAEIRIQDDGLVVADHDSTNGTFINGEAVRGTRKLKAGDLVQFANLVFRVQLDEEPHENKKTIEGKTFDNAAALIQFDRLITNRAVIPFYQPIVHSDSGNVYGYEVVGRSDLVGLKEPKQMFQAAAQLNLEAELSVMCRWVGLEQAEQLPNAPKVFLNTHPIELHHVDALVDSLAHLRQRYPAQAIVLEIHESALTVHDELVRLHQALQQHEIELAYDDFGAGQARLVELVEVPPQYVKFDLRLIQGIDRADRPRQQVLASLVRMVKDMGILSIAEGVETPGENACCCEFGFDLIQGFFHGRPGPVSTYAS